MRSRASLPRSRDGRRRIGDQGHAAAGAATRQVVVVRRVSRNALRLSPAIVATGVDERGGTCAASRRARRPAASARRCRASHSRLGAPFSAVRRAGGGGVGALVRGAAPGPHRRRARRRPGATEVGTRRREPVDLPPEPVHAAAARLRAVGEQPRPGVLPRASGDAGHARVRRLLRDDARTSRRDRPHPGDKRGDGGARGVDRDRAGEGAPHPDRHRRRRVPPAGRRRAARSARPARSADLRLRRRLVPEGRDQVGARGSSRS